MYKHFIFVFVLGYLLCAAMFGNSFILIRLSSYERRQNRPYISVCSLSHSGAKEMQDSYYSKMLEIKL
jgi:hypothetical protein